MIVEDTGIGIPKEKFSVIFDHFSRLTPSYQGIYKGSGLGLYTIKSYLGVLKGTIEVQSEVDKGSRFIVTIPLQIAKKGVSEGKIKPSAKMEAVKPVQLETPAVIKSKAEEKVPLPEDAVRILLVEDHVLAAKVAMNILQKLNCAVDHASSGKDAIRMLKEKPYELIYMDIGLPDRNGLEVTREIRKLPDKKISQIPIVALTAHMNERERQNCLKVGMQEMITKPLTELTAQETINQYVYGSAKIFKTKVQEKRKELMNIDMELGTNLASGKADLARELLDMLVTTLPSDYEDIQKAYKKKDYDTLYNAVHRFYGSLCYCGVPRLQETAKALKLAAKGKESKKITKAFQNLIPAVDDFLKDYKKLK
jgi:CheY-like chemotaxis protein